MKLKRKREIEFEVDGVGWKVSWAGDDVTFYEYVSAVGNFVVRRTPPPFIVQTAYLLNSDEGTCH